MFLKRNILLIVLLLGLLSCKNNSVVNNEVRAVHKEFFNDSTRRGKWKEHISKADTIHLTIKDSLVNGQYVICFINKFLCNKNFSVDDKTNRLRYKDTLLLNDVFMFFYVLFDSINQNIEFIKQGRVVTSISNGALIDSISKKSTKLSELEGITSVVDKVVLLHGYNNDLYLISDGTASIGDAEGLYDMEGKLLWYRMNSKNYQYESGDYIKILKKSGLPENALEEDYLKKCLKLWPIY